MPRRPLRDDAHPVEELGESNPVAKGLEQRERLPPVFERLLPASERPFRDTALMEQARPVLGLDCGLFESGFARAICPKCCFEFLVAFSCKERGLCPSCGAKRAAIFSSLLHERILADVPHAQCLFSIPKMLRPYFLFHRELLGELSRIAYETVREMIAAALDEPDARPGMVAVIQTFGSSLKWNPHIHAIVTRGVLLGDGSWQPLPYVDTHKAEFLFTHKVFRLLRQRELITQDRIDLLLSWRHSGFSVHNRTTVCPADTQGLHKLACYLMRSPVNLSRLRYHPDSQLVLYQPKAGHDVDEEARLDPLEFLRWAALRRCPATSDSFEGARVRTILARVLIHVPEPNKHLVHFYRAYANRVRSRYRKQDTAASDETEATPSRPAVNKRWAELIYRIYEVDPLTCPRCDSSMKLLAFITEQEVIRRDPRPPRQDRSRA